jgi:hypothetical protein
VQYPLLEAVPEDTSGILDHADIGGNIGLLILDEGDVLAFPRIVKQAAEIIESSETPVTLIGSKAVCCD